MILLYVPLSYMLFVIPFSVMFIYNTTHCIYLYLVIYFYNKARMKREFLTHCSSLLWVFISTRRSSWIKIGTYENTRVLCDVVVVIDDVVIQTINNDTLIILICSDSWIFIQSSHTEFSQSHYTTLYTFPNHKFCHIGDPDVMIYVEEQSEVLLLLK